MKKPNLLIVDDNPAFTDSVAFVLNEFNVTKAHSPAEAVRRLNSDIDLILLDLVFDEKRPEIMEGLGFIPLLKETYPEAQIVVLTSYPAIETTVKAIKSGAADFINKKELDWSEWKLRLMNYARHSQQIKELKRKNLELETGKTDTEIIGNSPEIDFIRRRLKDLAMNSSDVSIFLTGETGTGKNLAVKYFLSHSGRKKGPYKEFSILELSESLVESELFGHVKGAFTGATNDKKGLFELADKGILFLDEIGDYDLKIQTKILRFLDEKTITPVGSGKSKKLDIKLILASNQNIPTLVKERKFREDLYQRINRVRIELPSLQTRKQDIPILAIHFFNHFRELEKTKLISIDQEVFRTLNAYPWPGNVRELQSAIWDACTKARLFGDLVLQIKHLKRELTEQIHILLTQTDSDNLSSNQERIANLELHSIDSALQKSFGQKAVAAEILGINADQLRYKVMKLYKEFPYLIKTFNNIFKSYKLE